MVNIYNNNFICVPLQSAHLLFQDPKKVTYGTTPGQGVVYNVVARDLITGATSAYVPMISYSCDFYAKIGGCDSLGEMMYCV